jgi:hypothetical protein
MVLFSLCPPIQSITSTVKDVAKYLGKSEIWVYKYQKKLGDRSRIMVSLCKKASVKYFKFHPFRHFTATILDSLRVPIRKWKKHYESQFKN